MRFVVVQRNDFTDNTCQKYRNNSRVVATDGSYSRSDDLLDFNVCRNVEFTLCSAFAPSVFVKHPFAFPVNL